MLKALCVLPSMKYREINILGKDYKWSATQDSEHPDLVVICKKGEIWVQVEIGFLDQEHNEKYINGNEELPVSLATASKVISDVVEKGYIKKYFESDIGLIYTESGQLIEN